MISGRLDRQDASGGEQVQSCWLMRAASRSPHCSSVQVHNSCHCTTAQHRDCFPRLLHRQPQPRGPGPPLPRFCCRPGGAALNALCAVTLQLVLRFNLGKLVATFNGGLPPKIGGQALGPACRREGERVQGHTLGQHPFLCTARAPQVLAALGGGGEAKVKGRGSAGVSRRVLRQGDERALCCPGLQRQLAGCRARPSGTHIAGPFKPPKCSSPALPPAF